MVIKWSRFRGTARGDGWKASIEMMDLPNPFWQARFEWLTPEATESRIETFEEGKLEQAYEWCKHQETQHEGRHNTADS